MLDTITSPLISIEEITRARHRLAGVALRTPLMRSTRLSQKYGADIWLKREDLQEVRSYKIRGSYNNLASLTDEQRARGVVCASAGNHAQGLAYACNRLGVKGKIYMPVVTPAQKVSKVRMFGGENVEIVLVGDTYDDAYEESRRVAQEYGMTYVHPFDDPMTIAGQGTVGLEILDEPNVGPIDTVLMAVGGGGLSAGVGSVFAQLSPTTELIGVEPEGAPAMHGSLAAGRIVPLETMDSFVDGAAVRTVGTNNFPIVQEVLKEVLLVPEGQVCATMLELYNEDGIVAEPAGALSVAALDHLGDIRGRTIVCVVGGGNNDITRTAEIQERALLWRGLKHYFIVTFPQRAGALREFLGVLGPDDDISHFAYTKKHNRSYGPAIVGIELTRPEDLEPLMERMRATRIDFRWLNEEPVLFEMLV